MSQRKNLTYEESTDSLLNEIVSALLFTIGLFSLISLILYSSESGYDLKNTMGTIGVFISSILGKSFGVGAFFLPIVMFYTAYIVFINKSGFKIYRRAVAGIILLFSLTALFGLVFSSGSLFGYEPAGGWIGELSSSYIKNVFAGSIGSYIIVTLLAITSLIVVTDVRLNFLLRALKNNFSVVLNSFKEMTFYAINYLSSKLILATHESEEESYSMSVDDVVEDSFFVKQQPEETIKVEDNNEPAIVFDLPQRNETISNKVINLPVKKDFKLPSVELLDPKIYNEIKIDKEIVYEKARLIEEKLKDFGVSGKVTEIRPGPVITMFEYKPAPGIKINKIASLENDLAMGLSAISIRIIAPIPGKNVIGIEVPNEEREIVALRELIENNDFHKSESILTLALGKDISGKPYFMDLRRAPHLMIAGTTGSGKSVLLNAILTSMLYKASPHELKFIMIDPKMLELSIYEDIPHLLHPVVTEPKKAAAALKWAVEEMESRYKLLSEEGVRDIESHNKNIEKLSSDEKWERWLPYIVIVIDELADLMMIAPNEIKESITRLSQKARAAGIHLIVATQRPSADVVAGLLKANFPSRISFHVSSKIDSRIILDTGGAESLLGKGDMLFLQTGGASLVRLQGALISDKEREKITEHLKSQGTPVYNELITHLENSEEGENFDDEKDELYNTALRLIAETKQASISMIQRRLRIGYNRAARIVEIMEKEGVIGPQESAGKPREVYIDINQIKEI